MTGLFFQEEAKGIRFWPHFDVYHRIGLKNFAFRMIRGLNLRPPSSKVSLRPWLRRCIKFKIEPG